MRTIYIYMTALLCLVSCITNDLPYPVIEPIITGMEVEGADNVEIDYENHVITAYFPEDKDLRNVKVTAVRYDHENVRSSVSLIGEHDLNTPLKFAVILYQEYTWKLVAVQDVEHLVAVSGQVGNCVVDPVNCRVFLKVGKKTNPARVDITEFKLGPFGRTRYSLIDNETGEVISEGEDDFINALAKLDMTDVLVVDATAFDVTRRWHIYLEVSDISVEVQRISAWTYDAYVVAMGEAGTQSLFKYRKKGADDWQEVAETDVDADGGTFTAHLKSLDAQTQYEVYVASGTDETPVSEFTTSSAPQLPNGSFEYASKVAGKDYYKFYDPACGVYEGSYMFWGSGNGEGSEGVNGSANMGIVITVIDTQDKVDGKQSVCAQTSQMVGILAAGNLFTGQFAGLVSTEGGKVNFGRPWTSRPKALKIQCKYTTGKIDIFGKMPPGQSLTDADYDRAQIKVALGVWDYKTYGGTPESPVHVNTTQSNTFVNFATDASTVANGDLIVLNEGYRLNNGEMVTTQTDQWQEYTIPLNYRDKFTEPKYIIISCAASQFGDYFTGCSTSKLWLDKFELVY